MKFTYLSKVLEYRQCDLIFMNRKSFRTWHYARVKRFHNCAPIPRNCLRSPFYCTSGIERELRNKRILVIQWRGMHGNEQFPKRTQWARPACGIMSADLHAVRASTVRKLKSARLVIVNSLYGWLTPGMTDFGFTCHDCWMIRNDFPGTYLIF